MSRKRFRQQRRQCVTEKAQCNGDGTNLESPRATVPPPMMMMMAKFILLAISSLVELLAMRHQLLLGTSSRLSSATSISCSVDEWMPVFPRADGCAASHVLL